MGDFQLCPIFKDTSGVAFPTTVLDARSGVPHSSGAFTLAPEDTKGEMLSDSVLAGVRKHCRAGLESMKTGKYAEAHGSFLEAFKLIPKPVRKWNATGWILVAMGETSVRAGDYEAAKGPLQDAMGAPGTIGNPWVHLRLGQVQFETGDKKRAADELTRAYMGGGKGIFADQDSKYFEYLKTILKPPPGGW